MQAQRHRTLIEDGTVYVAGTDTMLPVGDVETILDLLGGPAWEISYSERERARYPDLDTSDEGIIIDIVDAINAMTLEPEFVDTLAAQPRVQPGNTAVSPRLGLFLGRLLENLENGVR